MQYKCIYIYVHTCKHQGDQNEILSQSQDLKKSKTLRNHPISIAGFSLSPPWTPQPIQM